jgi:hypothetical protein
MLNTELLEPVKTYEWGQDREVLTRVSDAVKQTYGNDAEMKAVEKQLLSVLESDSTYPGKQFVCRQLRIIGTSQSVPALSKMLTDEETADMARYALESIPGSDVDAALRDALPKTNGKPKVGIINSLGQRRDKQSVEALGELIKDSDEMIARAAVAALGKIADEQATKILEEAKGGAKGKMQSLILDAYLLCADRLVADGKKAQALAIYKELQAQDLPKPIRSAALTGMMNAAKQ